MIYKRIVLSSAIATLLGCPLGVYADDTEIYFGNGSQTAGSNVLFLIDISTSMNRGVGMTTPPADRAKTKIAIVKEAFHQVLNDKDVLQKNISAGVMSMTTYSIVRQTIDGPLGEIDPNTQVEKKVVGSKTTLTQKVLSDYDDGYQRSEGGYLDEGPSASTWLYNIDSDESRQYYYKAGIQYGNTGVGFRPLGHGYGDPRFAVYRFNNILVKNPASVSLSKEAIRSAVLKFHTKISQVGSEIVIRMDGRTNAPPIRPDLNNVIAGMPVSGIVGCRLTATGVGWESCDVTNLVKNQISRKDWQDGNAISFSLTAGPISGIGENYFYADFVSSAYDILLAGREGYPAQLEIIVDNPLVADNKKTRSDAVERAVMTLNPWGSTRLVTGLRYASGYLSNRLPKIGLGLVGPYHFTSMGANRASPSPLGKVGGSAPECVTSHVAMITDGDFAESDPSHFGATQNEKYGYDDSKMEWDDVAGYMGKLKCPVFTSEDTSQSFKDSGIKELTCGRSLASWMARTSHSKNTGQNSNYVKTHTIALGVTDANNVSFLQDLAKYGKGNYYSVNDVSSMAKALKSVINAASSNAAGTPSANGVVGIAMDKPNSYDQRQEIFYGFYKTNGYDYWAGNVKGFKISHEPYQLTTGEAVQRAVVKDWSGKNNLVNNKGVFINNLSSAWSTKDSGDMEQGGVVGKLYAPSVRKLYTLKANSGPLNTGAAISLSSASSSISAADLALTGADNNEDRRKGLLDFIRGYDYIAGGVSSGQAKEASPKIGESSNYGVSLLSYGDCAGKSFLNCDFNVLKMVGFYATNDGFFRGYDLTTGKALFEFMPEQMLPIINRLEKRKVLAQDVVKSYGLDTRVVIAHDDVNNNSIVDGLEKAYAIVSAGKGGRYIYGIDITNRYNPTLAWVIEDKGAFTQLGDAWSVPVVGKIKVGKVVTSVIVFGGGYDTNQDNNPLQTADRVGNALYVVDVQTGQLLWSTSKGMLYSIPGQVAALTDSEGLMTDIFFGDMGGQIWRFVVNNGQIGSNLLIAGSAKNGIVASISGGGKNDSRRFYQTPMLYKIPHYGILTVNIGTGYKAHPLVKGNEDRFYSFRFPLQANPNSHEIIDESQLGELNPTDINTSDISRGFMLKLDSAKGEKVVSNAFADFDRLIFSTYIPSTPKGCAVNEFGQQRTYYFSIRTGQTMLATGYTEVSSPTLPHDATAYCNTNFCTVISSLDMLAGNLNGGRIADPAIIKRDSGIPIRKMGWTDVFSLSDR